MNYYEVCPATTRYLGESLTYNSDDHLYKGQVVEINIRNKRYLGVVEAKTARPAFKVSPIIKKIDGLKLTQNQAELTKWIIDYYPDNRSAVLSLFLPSYLSKYETKEKVDKKIPRIDLAGPKLNTEQSTAYKNISENKGTTILNGVTGSGKTRVYMELARDQVNSGRAVLVLTPEIALTAPLESQFREVFGDDVVTTNHSNLTPKQKLAMYQAIYESNIPKIIIGPRSSLFLPFNNLGLIIVDEFHDSAYKQESAPRYLSTRIAGKLAQINGARLLFGSATPSVNDYYLAEQKKASIVTLNNSAITNQPPKSNQKIIDLTESSEQTSYPLLSKSALDEISKALKKTEQVMVYINKRGSFRSVLCRKCSWQLKCPNCDLPLIYHQDLHAAVCHTCGHKEKTPASCPDCGSIEIFFSSPGTKSIAQALTKKFPEAKLKRYDKDNKKNERLESDYDALRDGSIDIIVGTQMISKGFDLPKLSLVVILIAENSLNFPDYTSDERSYQLIKQLSGRVNRGHRKGKVILQTFSPDKEIVNYAQRSWVEFYKEELGKRQALGFPPFWNALKMHCSNKSRVKAEEMLSSLSENLRKSHKGIKILGPSPSFIEKKQGKYHWQLIIMSKNRGQLVGIAKTLPRELKADLDPVNFL